MNRKMGLWAAIIVTLSVLLFAASMALGVFGDTANFSYFFSLILSWAFVVLCCAFAFYAPRDRRVAAAAGVAFACLYAGIIGVVYFTQLTTVTHQTAPTEVLAALTYANPGSLFFILDLFGYGLMALSTFFIGLSLAPQKKEERWLKSLLLIHGIFAVSCVALPMLGVFKTDVPADTSGVFILLFWCTYFTPIGILSIRFFQRQKVEQ